MAVQKKMITTINILLHMNIFEYFQTYLVADQTWVSSAVSVEHYLETGTCSQTHVIDFDCWCLTPLSAISWRPVLVQEEAGVHGENHRPWASNWYKLIWAWI